MKKAITFTLACLMLAFTLSACEGESLDSSSISESSSLSDILLESSSPVPKSSTTQSSSNSDSSTSVSAIPESSTETQAQQAAPQPRYATVPSVADSNIDDAIDLFTNSGIPYQVVYMTSESRYTSRKVSHTDPPAGTSVNIDISGVTIYAYDYFYMPDLSQYIGQERSELLGYLDITGLPYAYTSTTPGGTVVLDITCTTEIGGIVDSSTVVTIVL